MSFPSIPHSGTMAHHPTGETVEILGLNQATNGCSCPDHENCGSVVKPDVVVRLRKVQVIIQGKEESAIAAYWVTDGIDTCRVGFLPKHCVRHWTLYEGRLAQVTEMYKDNTSPHKRKQDYKNMGCCMAALISPCLNIPLGRTRPASDYETNKTIHQTKVTKSADVVFRRQHQKSMRKKVMKREQQKKRNQ